MFNTVYPEALPNGFSIFGLEIRFYALFILGGAILCTLYGYLRFGRKMNFSSDLVLEGLALGLVFGVIGARLYYVLFEHEQIKTFWDIFNTRNGGLAIHGAIIATAIFLPIWCKIRHVKLLTLVEIAVPLFMMAQVIGRWGNFMNQEAFGPLINTFSEGGLTKENIIANAISGYGTYSHPYIMSNEVLDAERAFMKSCLMPDFIVNQMYIETGWVVLNGETIYCTGYYHPTFLYESLMNLSLVLFMMIGRKYIKKYYVGDSIGVYLIGYGVVRFIIESLRTDPLMLGDIKVAQAISVLFVIGGIALLILRRVFKFKLTPCKVELYGNGNMMQEGYDKFGHKIIIKEETTLENNEEIKENSNE